MVETQQAISVAYSTLVVQLQPTPGLLPSRPKTFTVNQIASTVEAAFRNTSTAKTAKERLALTRVAGWLCDLLVSAGSPEIDQGLRLTFGYISRSHPTETH
jgi:hypothetical protein